jgi:hypothetical protein
VSSFYQIKVDNAQLDRLLASLSSVPKAIPKVMRNAVNDTSSSARAEIARRVSAATKLKQAPIKRRILIKKATLKNWRAWVRIKDSPLALTNFGARQTKKGVSFKGIDGKKNFQKRAFIAKANTAKNVWVRMKKGGVAVSLGESLEGVELVGRKPLQRLTGPSVADLYRELSGLSNAVLSAAMKNLNANIVRHVILALRKSVEFGKMESA